MFSCSVIIPSFNRAHCLPRALDSVLAQTLTPNEIIVIDDGSTDHTVELIKQNYPQVKLLTQTHAGVSCARNYGIQSATNDWIALLDSDDAWGKDKLKKQWSAINDHKEYLICHTDEIWYRHNRRVNPMQKHQKRGGYIFQYCLPLCAISPSSAIIHRQVFAKLGFFDESLPACEDYDLWLRITAHYPVLYLAEKLTLKYGGHADQLSKMWGQDRFRITALCKIIDSKVLTDTDKQAALSILQQKISIYIKGAKKRAKFTEVRKYESISKQYGLRLS